MPGIENGFWLEGNPPVNALILTGDRRAQTLADGDDFALAPDPHRVRTVRARVAKKRLARSTAVAVVDGEFNGNRWNQGVTENCIRRDIRVGNRPYRRDHSK